MRPLPVVLLCCGTLLFGLTACGTDAPPENIAPADTTALAIADSTALAIGDTTALTPDTTALAIGDSIAGPAVDSLIFASVADTFAVQPGIGAARPVDTLAGASLQAALDALRVEVARLSGAVASLERSRALLPQAGRDTTSAADAGTPQVPREKLRDAAQGARQLGVRIFLALIVLGLSFYAIRVVIWVLETLSEQNAQRRLFFKKLIPIARLTIWALVAYITLVVVFQLDQDSLLAASAALGVAVGFAAQDVLKNIFGGLLIIFDQPFQVGDKINVEGTYGEVVTIGLRSTRIVTPDDNLVSVPNSQVVDSQVANANAGALDCQVVVDLFLPGWVDVTKAKRIAYGAAANSKFVYLDKPIVVNVKDTFKETFLTQLKVKAYVLDNRYEFAFASDVTETAKAEFLRHGLLQPLGDVRPRPDRANGATPTSSQPEAS